MQRPRFRGLQHLRPHTRNKVLEALDECSRPLTADEIDNILKGVLFHSQRRIVADRLAQFDVIAMVYRNDEAKGA